MNNNSIHFQNVLPHDPSALVEEKSSNSPTTVATGFLNDNESSIKIEQVAGNELKSSLKSPGSNRNPTLSPRSVRFSSETKTNDGEKSPAISESGAPETNGRYIKDGTRSRSDSSVLEPYDPNFVPSSEISSLKNSDKKDPTDDWIEGKISQLTEPVTVALGTVADNASTAAHQAAKFLSDFSKRASEVGVTFQDMAKEIAAREKPLEEVFIPGKAGSSNPNTKI